MSRKLTEFEKKVYGFIKERNEMIVSNVPKNMRGAIPNLKNAGLLENLQETHESGCLKETDVRENHK